MTTIARPRFSQVFHPPFYQAKDPLEPMRQFERDVHVHFPDLNLEINSTATLCYLDIKSNSSWIVVQWNRNIQFNVEVKVCQVDNYNDFINGFNPEDTFTDIRDAYNHVIDLITEQKQPTVASN